MRCFYDFVSLLEIVVRCAARYGATQSGRCPNRSNVPIPHHHAYVIIAAMARHPVGPELTPIQSILGVRTYVSTGFHISSTCHQPRRFPRRDLYIPFTEDWNKIETTPIAGAYKNDDEWAILIQPTLSMMSTFYTVSFFYNDQLVGQRRQLTDQRRHFNLILVFETELLPLPTLPMPNNYEPDVTIMPHAPLSLQELCRHVVEKTIVQKVMTEKPVQKRKRKLTPDQVKKLAETRIMTLPTANILKNFIVGKKPVRKRKRKQTKKETERTSPVRRIDQFSDCVF